MNFLPLNKEYLSLNPNCQRIDSVILGPCLCFLNGSKEPMGYPSALVSLFCQSILLEYMIFLHPSLSGKASSFRIPGYRDPPHVCVSICPLVSFFSGSLYQSLSLLGRLDLMDLFS